MECGICHAPFISTFIKGRFDGSIIGDAGETLSFSGVSLKVSLARGMEPFPVIEDFIVAHLNDRRSPLRLNLFCISRFRKRVIGNVNFNPPKNGSAGLKNNEAGLRSPCW
jgi:hypothetical protein